MANLLHGQNSHSSYTGVRDADSLFKPRDSSHLILLESRVFISYAGTTI